MEEVLPMSGGPLQANQNDLTTDSLELFKDYEEDLSMITGRFSTYSPQQLHTQDVFEFEIESQGMSYLYLPASRLYVRARILDAAGGDMVADDEGLVAYSDVPLAALFTRIDVRIDGVPMPDLSNAYSNYKGYFDTMLSYSQSTMERNMITSGALADTPGGYNNFYTANRANLTTNAGFARRSNAVGRSNRFEFMAPIYSDFFQIGKYFPPGMKITVRLTRSPHTFAICSSARVAGVQNPPLKEFKFHIDNIMLYIRHVQMNDSVLAYHQKLLGSGKTLCLPYKKTDIKVFTYSPGMEKISTVISTGTMPYHLMVGFIRSRNFYGALDRNPWYFENLGLDDMQMSVNEILEPTTPYRPNFTDNLYIREYREFLDNMGISHTNNSNVMTPLRYKDGLTLWAWDLTPDQCNGYHIHPRKTGTMKIEAHFQNAFTESITMLAVFLYHAKFNLTKDKKGEKRITTSATL